MNKNKIPLMILFLILFASGLFLINRDVFHYSYTLSTGWGYSPEENEKGSYAAGGSVPLKKGQYTLTLTGASEGRGSGFYLSAGEDEVIWSADIPEGTFTESYRVNLPQNISVRCGFSYDPAAGRLEIEKISLQSGRVLYKESLLRHLFYSLLFVVAFIYLGLRLFSAGFSARIREKTGINLAYCEKVFVFLVILICLAVWPYFDTAGFTAGDDFFFHLARIDGMVRSLKAGYFPPRILLGWMDDYGVGCGFYYPDMLMFIPAFLCMLGITAVDSLRIFMILCTFFSLLSIYLSAKNIAGGGFLTGAAAAVLYAFSAYRLICVFYRNAVGEVQAFIFYPLIVWGLIDILRGKTEKWKVFALGFFGLLMSHMISLAIAGVLCAICLLVFIRRVIRDRGIFLAFGKAAAVTLLLGAFFLLPMAEQAMKNELEINALVRRPLTDVWNSMILFSTLILPFSPWDHVENNAFVYPGLAVWLVVLVRLILLARGEKRSGMKTADAVMLSGLLLLFAATDKFPWEYFKWFLARIQFSWRLYGTASVLMSIAGGIYFEVLLSAARHKKILTALLFAAVLSSGFPILLHTYNAKLIDVEKLSLSDNFVNGAEYIPPYFFLYDSMKDRVLTDAAQTNVTGGTRQKLGYVFSFERESDGAALDYSVPLIYYYGYRAYLTGEDGVTRKVPAARDEMGLLSVSDEGLRAGSIRVSYEKTAVQRVSEIISLCTLLSLCAVMAKKKMR